MLLNLDMIAGKFSDYVTQYEPGGHSSLLSIDRWQMYDGETELKPSVLYLAEADMIRSRITGPDESAVIVLGNMGDAASKLKCPFLTADEKKTDMIQLINDVAAAFYYYDEIDKKLFSALYEGESFQTLVDIFSPVMSNELILMNSDFQLVGQTHPVNRLYEQNSFVQDMGKDYIPSEVLTYFKNDPVYTSVRDEREPFLYLASIHNVDIWCMNVFLNNEFICRVTMPESENKFRPYDKELLKYFTGFVQKKYNDLRADDSYQQNSRLSGLLLKLLEGKDVEENLLDRALGPYRIGSGRICRCMVLLPSERDYYNKTLSAYCDYIEKHYSGAVAFEYEKSIVSVLILPVGQKENERFHRSIVEFLRDNYLRAGFSNTFSDIREISVHYHQAQAALKTGLRRDSFKWVFTFQEECLSYMKEMITAELPPEYLCSPKLMSLIRYDKAHKTDYIKTLTAYIDNGRNAVETAKSLFLHRSTMMYRLKRIREITGIDFDDPDELLYLMISIRLLAG